jgi:hypothetical protein
MKLLNAKYILSAIINMISILHLHAQTIVSGKVMNSKKEPVVAAGIRIKESNIGVSADSLGNFFLSVSEKGKRTLEVSSVGIIRKKYKLSWVIPHFIYKLF